MGVPVKERNIALAIVFTIITCGIYGIYWLYKLAEETDLVLGTRSDASPAMVIVFSIITCGIYEIYWCYKQGEKFEGYGRFTGRDDAQSWGVLMLVLAIASYFCGVTLLIAYAMMQDKLNNISRGYSMEGAYANTEGSEEE